MTYQNNPERQQRIRAHLNAWIPEACKELDLKPPTDISEGKTKLASAIHKATDKGFITITLAREDNTTPISAYIYTNQHGGDERKWNIKDAITDLRNRGDLPQAKTSASASQSSSATQPIKKDPPQPTQPPPTPYPWSDLARALAARYPGFTADTTDATPNYFTDRRLPVPPRVMTYRGNCFIPMTTGHGDLATWQIILKTPDGYVKKFAKDRPAGNAFYPIRPDPNNAINTIAICEGAATGMTLRLTQLFDIILCAMSASNIDATTRYLRGRKPQARIYISGDRDDRNALEAANANDATYLIPPPLTHKSNGGDMDDLRQAAGIQAVKTHIMRFLKA